MEALIRYNFNSHGPVCMLVYTIYTIRTSANGHLFTTATKTRPQLPK